VVVSARKQLILGSNGVERVLETNRDITERKLGEEALRESQERFRIAQELSPDGFTIFRPVRNAEGRVVDFTWVYENAAIARMNGTDPSAVLGKRLLDVFPGHRGTQFFEAYQQVAESGQQCIFEDEYTVEELPTSWYRIAVVPAGGDIAILAEDIAERKRAEEALIRSEKLASAGRMAATIAHEINNPLAAVTNTIYLARTNVDQPDSLRQYLDTADEELKRIAHITRQALGFYRESNAPALTSVNALLESALDLLKKKIEAKGVVIEKQWHGEVEITAVTGARISLIYKKPAN
jgi:signal transduction histidine kinase